MPYVPGGVGETPDGESVLQQHRHWRRVRGEHHSANATTSIPEGVDPAVTDGQLNPAMKSWTAFSGRVHPPLPKGFTRRDHRRDGDQCRSRGTFARAKGVGKTIGVARNAKELAAISDLDERITMAKNSAGTDFSSLGDVDLVLDYLYGPTIVVLLNQLKSRVPTQFVQIGTVACPGIALPGAVLRSRDITMRGATPGAWPMSLFARELPTLVEAVGKLPDMQLTVRNLEKVEAVWGNQKERPAFAP